VRDWKKHELSPASPQEPKQEGRHRIQNNGLTGDEQKGYPGIDVAMLTFEPVQPVPQEMKNEKEVASDQNRINRQFNGESSEAFGSSFFHQADTG